jgi:ribosomal protein L29
MRGCKPSGTDYVYRLAGSEEAKQRLEAILATMTGKLRVQEACRQLGISPQRFDQVRRDALAGALAGLEGGKAGRPRKQTPEAEKVRALEEEIARLRVENQGQQARTEVALILSEGRGREAKAVKKKRR